MYTQTFKVIIKNIFEEYKKSKTIYGISEWSFFKKKNKNKLDIFGENIETPIGPAAGPHTQLTQNIITSYLVGGRFIELKTVQILEALDISKPCIYAPDEGYNTEWSTELTLENAFDEYLKAWITIHFLDTLFNKNNHIAGSFIFNMSIGYNYEGIKSYKMQTFLGHMCNAQGSKSMKKYLQQLEDMVIKEHILDNTKFNIEKNNLHRILQQIPNKISSSVTLSTMHGCPPDEIESICTHLLVEKKLNVFLKLNPTLLGYSAVRNILDNCGYNYIQLDKKLFEKDLNYKDALNMLAHLTKIAKNKDRSFGVKLTNTLACSNNTHVLQGEEVYLSGKALFPVSINLAYKLSHDFDGRLPISFSGGINSLNIKDVFNTGIYPITVATEILKPGGYLRLTGIAKTCEDSEGWDKKYIDVKALKKVAEDSLHSPYYHKNFRGEDIVLVGKPLPRYSCYIAPCVEACPISQNVPEYIYLAGKKRYKEALKLIYGKNALPNITGHICDHQCMFNCTRLDYEGAVKIREIKKIATDESYGQCKDKIKPCVDKKDKVAVIGSGPAGLSVSYFLSLEGFDVSVFEKEETAGGIIQNVLPNFRIPAEAIEKDVDFIKTHGVKFQFGVDPAETNIDILKNTGFNIIIFAIGAEKNNLMQLEDSNDIPLYSLDFLRKFKQNKKSIILGKNVVVVGGGNTAMDSARAAIQIEGVEKVTVMYRRTKHEMPADLEEYENAINDGVNFTFLAAPESYNKESTLYCRKMKLGEKDKSGRSKPIPTDETFILKADTLISAIGEQVDYKYLEKAGIPLLEGNPVIDNNTLETNVDNVYIIGDAFSGPSTVVRCIESARKVAESILNKNYHGISKIENNHNKRFRTIKTLINKELISSPAKTLDIKKEHLLRESIPSSMNDEEISTIEAKKCLLCSYYCNKCVEVCPNRANVCINIDNQELFDQPFQIIHIDAFCNECGNCETFCPWEGKPYKDKLTIFSRMDDFKNSLQDGFYMENRHIYIREDHEMINTDHKHLTNITGISEQTVAIINLIINDYPYLMCYTNA